MERLVVDGVPVFWEEGPEPAMVSLMFRTGIADEPAPVRGIGHLVEHLVLFAAEAPRHVANGFVDLLRTVFHARGTQQEVDEFLAAVGAQLPVPDLARLEPERRVLRTEAGAVDGFLSRQLFHRYGGASFGVADIVELGLRWITAEEIRPWGSERFGAANAALWVHGPRPPESVPLSAGGRRQPPPALDPRPRLVLPTYVEEGTRGVALTAVGSRSPALTLALGVANERLHEELRVRRALSYAPGGTGDPLGADSVHISIGADCLDEHADAVVGSLLETLERLAEAGATPTELDELRASFRRSEEADPDVTKRQLLDRAALDELVGRAPATLDELRAERDAVTPEATAAALRAALGTAIVIAPPGTPKPRAWLNDSEPYNDAPLADGRTFRPPGMRTHGLRVTVGDAGVSLTDKAGRTTITRDDVTAAVREPPSDLTVISRDGSWVTVRPAQWRDGDQLIEAIERLVAPTPIVPADDGPGADVARLAAAQLKTPQMANQAVAVVPPQLEAGERPEALAVASMGMRPGLIALTDRRVLFLWTGRRRNGVESVRLRDVLSATAGHIDDDPPVDDVLDIAWRDGAGAERKLRLSAISPKGRALELAREIARLRSA